MNSPAKERALRKDTLTSGGPWWCGADLAGSPGLAVQANEPVDGLRAQVHGPQLCVAPRARLRDDPTVDISHEGPRLDPVLLEIANNVCGLMRSGPHASSMAERLVQAGWRSKSTSWHAYELETTWCQFEIEPTTDDAVLLNGVVDPARFDDLAALLTRLRLPFDLELYDEEGALTREIQS
jgi:hypothetical protein